MRKRLFSLLTCLALGISLLPLSSLADGDTHTHCVCGKTVCSEAGHESATWTPWNGTDPITYDGGSSTAYVYLTANVEQDHFVQVESGKTLCLCLNGYHIQRTPRTSEGDWSQDCAILCEDAVLNICDCKDTGQIIGGTQAGIRVSKSYGSAAGGACTLYSGTITGANLGGVTVNSGCTFTMNGGSITENKKSGGGAGVCVFGTFTMNDGTISKNKDIAGNGGGGVYIWNGQFTMNGGSITENTTKGVGGGVMGNTGSTVALSGSAVIKGNAHVDGHSNKTTNNVYLFDNQTITADLTEGAEIGITTQTAPTREAPVAITGSSSADYSGYFFADDSDTYEVVNGSDNEVQLKLKAQNYQYTDAAGSTACAATLTKAFASAKDGSTITVLESCADSSSVTLADSRALTLDLNGKTVSGSGGNLVNINVNAGNLTITGNGKLDGVLQCRENGALTIENGTFGVLYLPYSSTSNPTVTLKGAAFCGADAGNTDLSGRGIVVTVEGDDADATQAKAKINALCAAGKRFDQTASTGTGTGSSPLAYLPASVSVVNSGSSSSGGSGRTTYSVNTSSDVEHGSLSVSPKNASKGTTVTVTTTPDKGWTLENLTVLDKNGKEIDLDVVTLGEKYTFQMPGSNITVSAAFMEDNTMLNYFADVSARDYCYDAVLWAVEKGITVGTDELHFSPNGICTRSQIVTFLWRTAGSPAPKSESGFSDVKDGSYYAKAVAWAVENGITNGTGNGKFSPDATCTRAQAVTFLYRASGAPAVSGSAEFSDVPATAYYADAVAWAVKKGIAAGIGGGLFGSGNGCTRAQFVTFLWRANNG